MPGPRNAELPMMEQLLDAAAVFLRPIANLFAPNDRIYWLYFYSAYLIALLVQLNHIGTWSLATVKDCIRDFFSKSVWGHRSARLDYKMLFLNGFGYFYIFPLITVSTTLAAEVTTDALRLVSGQEGLGLTPGWSSRAALTVIWLVAWDFGFFIAHYLQHRIPLLWEFHKAHHSAEVLTPFTVFRMHPIDDMLTYSTVGMMAGLVGGCFRFCYADPVQFYMINGLNIFWFVALMAGYHLRHSHIWVMYPKPFSAIFSSPALHLIHHSNNPKHFNKNYARIFVFWDRLAGTLYLPASREPVEFGLGGGEERDYQSLGGAYLRPFSLAARRLIYRPANNPS